MIPHPLVSRMGNISISSHYPDHYHAEPPLAVRGGARRFLFRYFHKNFMMCRFCSRQRSGVSSTSAKCKHKNSREFYNLEEGG